MMNPNPVDFLPEAVDPEHAEWTVHESVPISSCVNLATKEAHIPRARTRASEQIRFHELMHIQESDQGHHETDMAQMICNMLEEFRVDWLLKTKAGIDVRNRHDDFDLASTHIDPKPFPTAMFYLQLRFQATGDTTADSVKLKFREMHDRLPLRLVHMLEQAIQGVSANPTKETREEMVKYLLKYFMPPPPPPQPQAKVKQEVMQEILKQQQEEAEAAKAQQQKEENKLKKPGTQQQPTEPEPLSQEEINKLTGVGGMPMFGQAEVHDHLARDQKFIQVKAPFTRTGRGMVPEFMEHYLVDRRIYRTEHRGGVLVIDTSGSMRPNWPLIQAQMHDFPNLVVLSYGGVSGNAKGRAGIIGRICVHARAGRIDPHFQPEPGRSGGNDVDVEALLYGAKFKGPRIWVSDGAACGGAHTQGKSHGHDFPLATKIRGIMQQHHYIRVRDLESALKWVTSAGPIHYYLAGMLDSPSLLQRANAAGLNRDSYATHQDERFSPYWGTASEYHRYGRRSH